VAGTGAVALARIAAGAGGSSAATGSTRVPGGTAAAASANSGGYSNSTNDSLITQALTSNNRPAMYSWQDFLSAHLPMTWPPQPDYQSSEIASNLTGVYPPSPTLSISPEDWYFVK
jgi:hypothetical protein